MYNRLWNRWSFTQHYQRHFGCDKLTGAELEDQGEEGTALTHWEKRLFENEAMTGTHTQNPIYSRITMALMEDTGWYQPNYDMAEELKWGRGLGCDFALKSCKVNIYRDTLQFTCLFILISTFLCQQHAASSTLSVFECEAKRESGS